MFWNISGSRIEEAVVQIGTNTNEYPVCRQQPITEAEAQLNPITVQCDQALCGTHLRVHQSAAELLTLCEVLVYRECSKHSHC